MDSSSLDINQYADLLLPPIIAKWNLLGDFDEGLLSILECLYYLIVVRMILTLDNKAMGTNFAPMAANVYQRCMRIIDSVNVAYITQSMEVGICFYCHVEGGISTR